MCVSGVCSCSWNSRFYCYLTEVVLLLKRPVQVLIHLSFLKTQVTSGKKIWLVACHVSTGILLPLFWVPVKFSSHYCSYAFPFPWRQRVLSLVLEGFIIATHRLPKTERRISVSNSRSSCSIPCMQGKEKSRLTFLSFLMLLLLAWSKERFLTRKYYANTLLIYDQRDLLLCHSFFSSYGSSIARLCSLFLRS